MPEIFAAIRSGQELKSLSALYEYLGAVLVLTMPSAVALADWPGFEWGRTGVGPSFPSLDSLEMLGVDLDQLQVVVNALYNLHAESPPMYLQGGALRKTLLRSFATQLMYYEERWHAVEMRAIQVLSNTTHTHTHTHTHTRTPAHTHSVSLFLLTHSICLFVFLTPLLSCCLYR